MPELPEVETIKRQLNKIIVGKKITDVKTDTPKMLKPSLSAVKKAVIGKTIQRLDRKAKVLQIHLTGNQVLIIHLKMTGRLLVRKEASPKDNWQHITFSLTSGFELRFADQRKFGWIKLISPKELAKILSEFGPEPFDLSESEFTKIIQSSHRKIKVHLMDQEVISGIGNIYACDALNLSQINPTRKSSSLSEKETIKLFSAINKVLQAGIKYGGASDNSYLNALGQKGHYQEHFLVYNRAGSKCFQCGHLVKKVKLAGRGTFYCPNCQR